MQKLLVILLAFVITTTQAQVKIGNNPTSVNGSSLFEMESTNKGLLIPRVTTAQRTAITTPAKGLMVFDNTTASFWFYNGNAWTEIKTDSTSVSIKDKILQVSTDSAVRIKIFKSYNNQEFRDIIASGNDVFVAAGLDGIIVFNNASSGYLYPNNVYNTPGYAWGIDVKGNYAYVADGDSLQIINLTTRTRTGAVYIGESQKVFATTTIAYVACGNNGLKLVNITNPANPSVISTYSTPEYALDVIVNGNYAYVADAASLQIINVTNPLSPTFTGSYPSQTDDVWINGNYAYVNNAGSLNIINISNPANPVLTYEDTYVGNGKGILFRNNRIYQSASGGLAVFNGSNPSSANLYQFTPSEIGAWSDLASVGNYIIGVNQFGGIESYRVETPSNSLLVTKDYVQMDALSGGENAKALVFADQDGKLSKPFDPDIQVSDILLNHSWSNMGKGLKFKNNGRITMQPFRSGDYERSRIDFGYGDYPFLSMSNESGMVIDADSTYDGDFSIYRRVLRFGGINSKAGIGSKAYGSGGNMAGLDFYTNNISRLALSSAGAVTIDPTGSSDGTLTNGLRFGDISHGEGITSQKTGSGNLHGLEFFTSFNNRMSITNGGNIGINNINPLEKLDITGNMKVSGVSLLESLRIDNNSLSNGTISSAAIRFGNGSSGEGILSKKTAGGNQNGLDFFTNSNARITIANGGNVGISNASPAERLDVTGNAKVSGNVTVQNGKGVIRSINSSQLKMGSHAVTVNTSLAAGATTSVSFTWTESFTAAPVAYVGSVISGAGGWAEVVMTVAEVTTTGGKLYVYNPKTSTVNPNFSINVVGIGAQ